MESCLLRVVYVGFWRIILVEREGTHLVPLVVDFNGLPVGAQRVVDQPGYRLAVLCPDIKLVAVSQVHLHNLPCVRAAVHPCSPYPYACGYYPAEDALQRLFLHEGDRGVAVTVLHPDYVAPEHGHGGAVAGELLVGPLRIVLSRLKELVVEVEVHRVAGHYLPQCHEHVHEQLVESVGGVHLIVIAPGRCVCYVVSSQLADAAQHGVGARDPCAGPLAQGVHQEGVEVFDAGAAAEADAEHGTEDLAVLKSSELRPFAQLMVDQPAQMFSNMSRT